MLESQLLSKVLDEDKFYETVKYGLSVDDFPTLAPVYTFIHDYVKENGGNVPDYRTVVTLFPTFDYMPEVSDGFKYLAKRLKAQTAKRQAFQLLQIEAGKQFKVLDGTAFSKWLKAEADKIERQADLAESQGTNFATNGAERKEWYSTAKEQRTHQFIPTPYRSLTAALGGGFELGDYLLILAGTNRGKSWISSDIGLKAWINKFGVIHYSPELSKRQQSLRLDTLCGFYNNVDLRRGKLSNEDDYLNRYLNQFTPESGNVPYIIKTMEDLPSGLSIDVIEQDLQSIEGIKMVIIDGFNLMNHGRGGRDAMTMTSRKLRQLFGRYGVVGVVVHQTTAASQKEDSKDDDGTRLVTPPKLTDFSETVAVIQDAATVLTFDQAQGIGRISVEKAREPSVGLVIELAVNFNMGVIREQDVTDHF